MTDAEKLLAHAQFVRAVAHHLVADPEAADDVSQEVWTRTLAAPPRHDTFLRSWLAKVARNVAFRRARSESRRRRHEIAASRPEEAPPSVDLAAREDAMHAVVDAVTALDEIYRAVVILRFYDDLPPREVARRLGVPVETVRTRQKRALTKLRAMLDARYGGDRRAWAILVAWGADGPAGAEAIAAAPPRSPSAAARAALVGGGGVAIVAIVVWSFRDGADAPRESTRESRVAMESSASSPQASAPAAPSAGASAPAEDAAPADGREDSAGSGAVLPPSTGAVVARLTWDRDGSPAASIRAELTDEPRMFILGQEMNLLSEADGVIRTPPLAPGDYTLYLDRAEKRTPVRVEAGRVTEISVALPPGVAVEGSVIDAEGSSVAGAEIVHVRPFFGPDSGVVVAVTDSAGHFSARDLPENGLLGARRAGFAPSLLFPVAASLRIDLGPPGAGVAGMVRAPDGTPVAAARVTLATESRPTSRRPASDGRFLAELPTPRLVTGESGEFACLSMEPGRRVVVVTARGFADWKETVDVPAGERVRVDVTLRRGGTVVGRVIGLDGAPVAGVEIAAADTGAHWCETSRKTESDASGAFRLEHLRAGEISLHAATKGERGSASASAVVAEGAETRWDAFLTKGLVIAGVVTDERGTPLEGWDIVATPPFYERSSEPSEAANDKFGTGWIPSDSAGRFELTELRPLPYRVEAHAPGSLLRRPAVSIAGVSPGGSEIALRVPEAGLPSASIRGIVVSADGKPVVGAAVIADFGFGVEKLPRVSTNEAGEFRLQPLPPGTYAVVIAVSAPRGLVRLEETTLAAHEDRDVGAIRIGAPGALVVRFSCDEGVTKGDVQLQLRVDGLNVWVPFSIDGDTARSGPIAPGEYELAMAGGPSSPNVAMNMVPVTIEPGRETVRDIALRAGVATIIAIRPNAAVPDWSRSYETEVRESPGGRAVIRSLLTLMMGTRTRTMAVLAPGEYEVTITSDAGFRGATRFTVPAAANAEPAEVEVHLR